MTSPEGFAARQARISAEQAAETLLPRQREIFLRAQAAWEAIDRREVAMKIAREKADAARTQAVLAH
ncbi:MAG: hypothetical protein RIS94_520 [Pseudomonadota bacterium]|jgi:hypothetical protein